MDIFEAINLGDISKIKENLARGFDPTVSRSDGLKPLHVAAIMNRPAVLELLLKQHNVQCDITDKDGNTPLHLAAKNACVDSVKTLIAFGASPNITNKTGKKPIDFTKNSDIQNILSETMNEASHVRGIQQARIEFLKQMESQLPNDLLTLKTFSIEFLLATQLFQERCKETIYQLVRDKHEAMYKQRKLEKDAGIRDRETGETFLENLEKIEEENEIQAATIARLKIQNHMLEQHATQKTEVYRKNLSEMLEQQMIQVKSIMESLLEKETKYINDIAELSNEIYAVRQENGELISKMIGAKPGLMKASDLQFLQSIQNDNYLIQKSVFDTQSECTVYAERLKSMETLKTMYEKYITKIRNDSTSVRKALQDTMTKAFTEARTEADDKEEESGHILFARGENGRKQVKAATLEKLFDRLTDPSTYDNQFQTTFLLTFRSFTDTNNVLNYMIKRYKDSMVTNTSNPSSQSASHLARQRICQTIKDWIEICWFDFQEDKNLMAKLTEFVEYVNRHNSKNANLIRTALNRKTAGNELAPIEKGKEPPPKPILPKALAKRVSNAAEVEDPGAHQRTERSTSMTAWSNFTFTKHKTIDEKTAIDEELKFMDLDPMEIARQLTLLEYQLFTAIRPTEFLDQAWVKEDKEKKAPNICAMIKWSHHVTMWVVSEILVVKDLKLRALTMEKLIMIAQSLEQINNFNGVKEVLNGLQLKMIKGLSKTRELVSAKLQKTYDDLEKLTNQELNYKHLRAKIHQASLPLIPYPGIYQADLASIDNGSKNILENRMINFSKYQKLANYITELQVYQQTPYNFEQVHEISDYIREYDVLTESEATKFANNIETKM